ncbi:hypothetical protein ACLOJK_005150 [Asimina triloba]
MCINCIYTRGGKSCYNRMYQKKEEFYKEQGMDALGGPVQGGKIKPQIKNRDLRQCLHKATPGVVRALELLPLLKGIATKVVGDDQGSSIGKNRCQGLTASVTLRPLRLHRLKLRHISLQCLKLNKKLNNPCSETDNYHTKESHLSFHDLKLG